MKRSPLLRKTPLARSNKPLPRRRRKPRTGINLSLRSRYKTSNPNCELSVFFPNDYLPTENGLQALVGHDDPIDAHHILANCRVDMVTNLICARRRIHEWADRHTIDGRVLSLCVKARKGELDTSELSALLSKSRPVNFADWFSALESRLLFEVSRRAYREVATVLRRAP